MGATTDLHGGSGWSKTNDNFGKVLEALRREHHRGVITKITGETTTGTDAASTVVTALSSAASSNPNLTGKEDRKREKKERRSKKRQEKMRE